MADNENTPPATATPQAKPLKPCVQCGKPAVARYQAAAVSASVGLSARRKVANRLATPLPSTW